MTQAAKNILETLLQFSEPAPRLEPRLRLSRTRRKAPPKEPGTATTDPRFQPSKTDREELAIQLLESLDPGDDENADSEWAKEIQRRIEEIRTGQVKGLSWTEARSQIMDDHDGDR